jgi:hypothetical protein
LSFITANDCDDQNEVMFLKDLSTKKAIYVQRRQRTAGHTWIHIYLNSRYIDIDFQCWQNFIKTLHNFSFLDNYFTHSHDLLLPWFVGVWRKSNSKKKKPLSFGVIVNDDSWVGCIIYLEILWWGGGRTRRR